MKAEVLLQHLFGDKVRKTGDPYMSHPYAVKQILKDNGINDKNLLDAALLHDVIEDSHITSDYLKIRFGAKVSKIVDILSKKSVWTNSYCKMKSNLDQMSNEWVEHPEAILIKMADRLHNLQTIEGFKLEKQKEYIKETKDLLLPLFKSIIRQNNAVYLEIPLEGIYKELIDIVKRIESTFK